MKKNEVLFYVDEIGEPVPLTGLIIAHGNCGGGVVNVNDGVIMPFLECSVCGYAIGLRRPEDLVHTALTGEPSEERFYDEEVQSWTLRLELMSKEVRRKLIPQGLRALRRVYELEKANGRLEERVKTLETANDRLYAQVARLERMLRDLERAGHVFADAVYATRRIFQSAELARARRDFLHKMAWLGLT